MDWRACSPPIQSIWIEEDQFMEKMYGFQMNQIMNRNIKRSNTIMSRITQENLEHMQILILNSDKPQLDNKTNIRLNISPKSTIPNSARQNNFHSNTNNIPNDLNENILKLEGSNCINNNKQSKKVNLKEKIKRNFRNGFSKLLNKNTLKNKLISNSSKSSKNTDNFNISYPFCFQHISHGNEPTEWIDYSKKKSSTNIKSIFNNDNENNSDNITIKDSTNYASIKSNGVDSDNSQYEAFSKFCTPKPNSSSNRSIIKRFSLLDSNVGNGGKYVNNSSVRSSLLFELDKNEQLLSSPTTLVESLKQE